MCHVIGPLLIGAIAGRMTGNPDRRRPLVRRLVKGGIIAKHKIETAGAAVASEARKIVKEARADLDGPGMEPQS